MNISLLRNVTRPFISTSKSAGIDFYLPCFDLKFIVDFCILNKLAKEVKLDSTSVQNFSKTNSIIVDPLQFEFIEIPNSTKIRNEFGVYYNQTKNYYYTISNPTIRIKRDSINDLFTNFSVYKQNFLRKTTIISNGRIYIQSHQTVLIPSGISTRVPDNYFLYLLDKSSMAINKNLKTNAGVVDADYKDEIGFVFFNSSNTTQILDENTKVIQGILLPFLNEQITPIPYKDLHTDVNSNRIGGFGSTGTN